MTTGVCPVTGAGHIRVQTKYDPYRRANRFTGVACYREERRPLQPDSPHYS